MKNLINSIKRSERAYGLYIESRTFLSANRIYKANELVYNELEKTLLASKDEELIEHIENYLFHLNDWMIQYEVTMEKLNPNLDSSFIFHSVNNVFKFPRNFIDKLLQI